MKKRSAPGRRGAPVVGLRRSSFVLGVAAAFAVSFGCTESESFFPPIGSSGAGSGSGAGAGGAAASTAGAPAGMGNSGAGSGGSLAAGNGGGAAIGGAGATGGVGGAAAGGAGSGGAGTGGTPIGAGTGGVGEGGQGNETGDAGESVGGAGLGGSAGTSGGGAGGASGSAGAEAGTAGNAAGAGGVAGTAGSGGANPSGGSAGNCGSKERCDGVDNDCNGDADEGAVCPAGCSAKVYEQHVYILCDYSDEDDYLDYADATASCAGAGAELELDRVLELARIESSEENAFVKAWITDVSGVGMVWFGANDLDQERIWVWGRGNEAVQFFTGSAQGGGTPYMGAFDDFADGRPSNGTGEDCGAFDSEFAWQWNDLACNRGRRGFVCEQRNQ